MNHLIEVAAVARHESNCTLSVVVPVFNEQEALLAFHRRLAAALAAVQGEWEVVYVDDGSTDATQRVLRKLQAGDPAVGVARFSCNFGIGIGADHR